MSHMNEQGILTEGEGSVQVASLKAHLRYGENYYELMGFKELKEEFCIKKT